MAGYTITLPKSSSSGSYIEGQVRLDQTIDKAKQSSSVTAKLYVRKGSTTTTLTIPTEGTWSYKLQIGDTAINTTVSKSVLTDWVYFQSISVNLKHASDGTLSIHLIASVTAPTGTSLVGETTKYDKTINLQSIQLPTTIDSLTCSTEYLDGVITAKYTPKVATFYNQRKVYVNVNGTLTEIHSQNLGQQAASQQTHTIQFNDEYLAKIYAAVKTTINATIQVRFITYSNSTYTARVGTVQYREIVLKIPTSVAPAAALTLKPVNSNSWIAEKNIYVAGLSGATATLAATPSAGIKEEELTTTITYDGATYNAKTLNVSTLKKSGNIKFDAKVTDPRGRSATATKSITVLPYSAPTISKMQVDRGTYNNGWTAADEGSDVRVIFKTTLSLNANGNVYSAAFKVDGSSKAPNYGATTGLKSGTDCTVYFLGINGEASHTLAMTVTDKTGGTGTANITIPTIHITIEFNDSGKGIAFGKTSEKDAFECGWDAEFRGSVKRIKDDGSIVTLDDTGWIDLGISGSVTTTSSTSAGHYIGCAYRVVNGNHVYVAFNVRAEYSGSAVTVSGNPIPSEYRPKLQPYAIVTLNGKRVSRILVSRTTGHAMIDWIHNVADDTDGTYTPEPEVHTATWIDGYIDYFI